MGFLKLATILFCLQLGFSLKALAAETASARQCRIEGGKPWTVNYSDSEDVMLCFFGRAAVGAAEFAQFKWNGHQASSLNAVLTANPSSGGASTCRLFQAGYREATDSNNTTWGLCQFTDGSVAEAKTLARGRKHSANQGLVHSLR